MWDTVCGSSLSRVVNAAPIPHRCLCTANLSAQTVQRTPAAEPYGWSDIILLVETKLDSSILTYSFLPINYKAIRNDRNHHSRGVLIAVRNDIIADP